MAKRSKADIEKEATALKETVAKARKKPLNIAMLVSKEGLAVASDLRKPTSVLVRAAKDAGGQPAKAAIGTLRVSGNKAELICENDRVPGTMAKIAKAWFNEHGIKLTFDIKLPGDAEEAAIAEEKQEAAADKKKQEKAEAEREKAKQAAKEEEEEVLAKAGIEPTEEEEEEIQASTGDATDDEEEEIDIEVWKERRMTIAIRDDFADLEEELDDVMDIAVKPMAKKIAGLAKMVEDNIDRDQKRASSALGLLKKTLADAKAQADANGGGSPADADGKLSEEARTDLVSELESLAADLEAFDAELEKEDA